MYHFRLLFAITILIIAFGCSGNQSEPKIPSQSDDNQYVDSSRIMSMGFIEFDPLTSSARVVPERNGDFHFNITSFIKPYFHVSILDFKKGVFTVKMTVENPTSIQAWDVRIYFLDLADKKVLNPDGFSDYYTNVVFVPFINFRKEDPDRAFPVGPGGTDSEILILDFNNSTNPNVYYLIECSLNEQLVEPVQIDRPFIKGVFLSNSPMGGAVIANVLDHQGDAIVTVDASQIGLGDSEPMFDDGLHGDELAGDGIFGSMRLIPSVEPGFYTLTVKAADPVTYPTIKHPFRIKVYPSPEMILIPVGEFSMGCGPQDPYYNEDWIADEKPLHQHPTDAYYIGKYEVTVGEYQAFVEDNGYFKQQFWGSTGWLVREDLGLTKPVCWDNPGFCGPDKLDHPMVGLCWYEAQAYVNWLSFVTGQPYRIPGEAEWERACRGDADDRSFPWGGYVWDKEKCNNSSDTKDTSLTSPEGLYSPDGDSPWGCADIAGNALEWTNDWYKNDIYTQYEQGNYTPPAGGTYKVARGGVWWWYEDLYFRCSFRWNKTPVDFDDANGLRLAKSAD